MQRQLALSAPCADVARSIPNSSRVPTQDYEFVLKAPEVSVHACVHVEYDLASDAAGVSQ